MEKFVIDGGVPLSGTVTPAGHKYAALPLLACALLTDEDVTLHNVPRIRDTQALLELLADLGVSVEKPAPNTIKLNAANVHKTHVDPKLAERIRASFLAAGPLLARFGSATMPPPGGDVIGRRRLDPHLDAFKALGATVEHGHDIVILAPEAGLRPVDFFMDEPSVMGTENALMAAAAVNGTTIIRNAACEPHVQDVARMLNKMGAAIEGIGSNVMLVHGVAKLGGCEYTVSPDHIEIASFMALAGVTGGELRIDGCVGEDLRMIRMVFRRLGLDTWMEDGTCLVPGGQTLRVQRDAGDYQSKVEDGPWPAFPADLTSIAVALATQSEGSVLIFEKMFENRLFFVDKLISMGAEITICDPHRAIVIGPRRLRGARLSSPDIRAGMAKLIAALCADGVSEIHNVQIIDRGYERIDARLRGLGARIERIPL
jgi:UDP-N-acetylglucosamine 1-carboxyvinyltransferase